MLVQCIYLEILSSINERNISRWIFIFTWESCSWKSSSVTCSFTLSNYRHFLLKDFLYNFLKIFEIVSTYANLSFWFQGCIRICRLSLYLWLQTCIKSYDIGNIIIVIILVCNLIKLAITVAIILALKLCRYTWQNNKISTSNISFIYMFYLIHTSYIYICIQ